MQDRRFHLVFALIMVFYTCASLFDMYHDHADEPFSVHNLAEILMILVGLGGLAWLWFEVITRIRDHEGELSRLQNELTEFQQRHGDTLREMRAAILEQFERWNFTPAEKRIAELLIKGYSLKQIAGMLNKSEKTVRNQTTALYEKGGLLGRSELAAFFLADLLNDDREQEA